MRLVSSYRGPAAAALALIVVSLLAGACARVEEKGQPRSITVSATGSVEADPDIARITSGVTTEGATAAAALAQNSERMTKLIAGLKESGVEPKDIQTSSFRVEPRYTQPKEGEVSVINGYRVSNQVQIIARKLDKLGAILDQLVSLGANELSGLAFEVSEPETLRDQARKEAVANALRRAQLYADAAGAEVGEVLAIQEGGEAGPRPMPMARAMKAEAVPIERGTETLEASVTVTWALR
jgi:uncharacterized protein YggE